MSRPLAPFVALGISLSLLACTSAPDDIDPRVTVVPADAVVEVTPDQLTFLRAGNELLADRTAGDILVSASGEGFLRRVLDVHDQGERVVLDTAPAELGDAILSGDVAGSLAIGDDGKADAHKLGLIEVRIGDQTVIDRPELTVLVHHAALAMRPILDLDLSVRERGVERFEAVLRSDLNAAIDLEVRVGPGKLTPSVTLWQSPPMVFYQQIGPVPVVETATISVGVDLEITAHTESRVRLLGSLLSGFKVGMRYEQRRWKRVAEEHHDVDLEIPVDEVPVIGDLDVRATLFARVDLKFYGVLGPYLKLGPYLEVGHRSDAEQLSGRVGLSSAVGGELRLLGVSVPLLPQVTLFDVSRPAF